MYSTPQFSLNDEGEIIALMQARPLATLVAAGPHGPVAAFAPLMIERDGAGRPTALIGHLASANPFGDLVADGARVLAIFHGADAYVSPSLYPSKQEHGRVVPTWNYLAVEAEGAISFMRDGPSLHDLVTRLTDRMEASRESPWAVSDAPPKYIDQMTSAIVGLSIAIDSLQGKAKLSQNRSEADRAGVRDGLARSRDPLDQLVASEMSRHQNMTKA
jgi:transcriptional regulator